MGKGQIFSEDFTSFEKTPKLLVDETRFHYPQFCLRTHGVAFLRRRLRGGLGAQTPLANATRELSSPLKILRMSTFCFSQSQKPKIMIQHWRSCYISTYLFCLSGFFFCYLQ